MVARYPHRSAFFAMVKLCFRLGPVKEAADHSRRLRRGPATLAGSRAGTETIMLLLVRWFDEEAPAGLAHAVGAEVERLLKSAEGHGLLRSQRERPHIAAFARAARRAYPELEERKRQVGKFCVALAATLHATSANHMKDAAAGYGTPCKDAGGFCGAPCPEGFHCVSVGTKGCLCDKN